MTRTGGIVLCGGRSSRMGRPKAWLPVGEELMLQRVVRIVGEAVGPVVVVAAPGQDVPPLPAAVRVVRDEHEGRGPLGGLAAGLAALGGECEAAYLSACDVPLLRAGFVRRVLDLEDLPPPGPPLPGRKGGEGGQPPTPPPSSQEGGGRGGVGCICIPRIAGRLHPLAAAYALDLLPLVRERLAADDLRISRLPELVPTFLLTEADFADVDPELASLRNVNTPEEYAALLGERGASVPWLYLTEPGG